MRGNLVRILLYRGLVARRYSIDGGIRARFRRVDEKKGSLPGGDPVEEADLKTITLFSDHDRAYVSDDPRMAWEKFCGNRHSWRSRLSGLALVPKQRQLDAFGKIPAETANHGHFAFLDHDLAKTSDNPATVWEKAQRKPPIMASTLFLDRDCAKIRDNRDRLGKIPVEIANDGHFAFLDILCAKTLNRLGKIQRKPPIMAISKKG